MELYLWFGSGLLMGLGMYVDAKRRGLENPSVWIWIGLLLGAFGVVTYLYWHVWPNRKSARK